jgi:hypothetical protein
LTVAKYLNHWSSCPIPGEKNPKIGERLFEFSLAISGNALMNGYTVARGKIRTAGHKLHSIKVHHCLLTSSLLHVLRCCRACGVKPNDSIRIWIPAEEMWEDVDVVDTMEHQVPSDTYAKQLLHTVRYKTDGRQEMVVLAGERFESCDQPHGQSVTAAHVTLPPPANAAGTHEVIAPSAGDQQLLRTHATPQAPFGAAAAVRAPAAQAQAKLTPPPAEVASRDAPKTKPAPAELSAGNPACVKKPEKKKHTSTEQGKAEAMKRVPGSSREAGLDSQLASNKGQQQTPANRTTMNRKDGLRNMIASDDDASHDIYNTTDDSDTEPTSNHRRRSAAGGASGLRHAGTKRSLAMAGGGQAVATGSQKKKRECRKTKADAGGAQKKDAPVNGGTRVAQNSSKTGSVLQGLLSVQDLLPGLIKNHLQEEECNAKQLRNVMQERESLKKKLDEADKALKNEQETAKNLSKQLQDATAKNKEYEEIISTFQRLSASAAETLNKQAE